MQTDTTQRDGEAVPFRQNSVPRMASVGSRLSLCMLVLAALVGAIALYSEWSLHRAHTNLTTTVDDAVVSSAIARDAAVAIARMRTAELYRQHASEPVQASYFAMQVTASSNALKAKLRDIAEHAGSVPSRQALDRVTATFSALSDHGPPSLSTGAVFAKGIENDHDTAILEEQLKALWRSIDADISGAKAAIGTRIRRLELLQLSTTLIVVLLAVAAWPIARRLSELRRSERELATVAERNEVSGGSTSVEWLEGSSGAACEGGEPSPRSPEGRLVRALEGASDGVMLIDRAGRIIFANARAMALDGFVEILRASQPESVNGASESEIRLADGRWLRVSRTIAPDGSILALCADISADKERLRQLRADTRTLRTALDCMSQGLCLFDAARRLVVVNRRYSAIYGLDPNLIRSGLTTQELIELSVAAGNHPGQNLAELQEEARQAFKLGEHGPFIQKFGDGRVVQIQKRPTADGGFVCTYEDVSDRWHAEARIAHMARHDSLSGLPNRILLAERIDGAITQAGRDRGFAVLCLDLDNFKPVNDALGHAVGDELLQAVAHRLRACVREIDTVARLGGDEFAIVQAGLECREDADILAKRIIEVVSEPYELSHHTVTVGLSIGIALAPLHGMQANLLLKNADVALYRAKDQGRGTRCFFEPEMDARLQGRRLLEADLRAALAAEAFELYYQPIYDLREDRICGFEALLRWTHPVHGSVSPADFVPIAEEIGLIVPLGEWVVRRACAQAVTWPDDLKVAVNISAAQFQSAQLVDVIRSALAQTGLAPRRLELEITESVLLVNGTATRDILHALRELGARVSMDDFGTGYSSLSYLRSFPFDKMKIDRSFIRDLTAENGSDFIVRAVISLGGSLGMTMTAEGVETEEQLARLREENCDEVQGFLFSPPVPVVKMPALLERWNTRARVAA